MKPAFYTRSFVHNKHFLTQVLMPVLQILTFLLCGKQVGPVAHEQTVWRAKLVFMSCSWWEKKSPEEKTSFSVAVMAEVIAGINLCVIDVLISTPLFAAPLRRASSCWINVRSSYVFRNLTPDSFRPPHNHSRQPVDTAADTSPTSAPHVCA